MACCSCKKTEKGEATPDCSASKSTLVTTPEGEEVCVTFNMGTGEITYDDAAACACGEKSGKKEA